MCLRLIDLANGRIRRKLQGHGDNSSFSVFLMLTSLKSVVNVSGPLMVRLDSNPGSISVVLSKKMIPLEVVSLFLSEKII